MSVQLDWTTSLPSISSAAASPVRISRTPARARGSQGSAPDSGANIGESLASFDLDSSSWKTSQRFLLGGWVTFSGTWPRSGMMRNGTVYELPTWAPPTVESGCSLWPTPLANDATGGSVQGYNAETKAGTPSLARMVRLWPTPSAANPNDSESLETWAARREELKAKGTNGNGCGTPLGVAVRLWPTPTRADGESGPGRAASAEGSPNLRTAAQWATPTARDWKSGQASAATMARNSRPLNEQVVAKMWPTPNAFDSIEMVQNRTPEQHAAREAALKAKNPKLGELQKPLAMMVGAGSLNPAWVSQLMGFPPGWTDGLPAPEKRNTRGKRRASSDTATTEPRASRPLATRSSRKSAKSSGGS